MSTIPRAIHTPQGVFEEIGERLYRDSISEEGSRSWRAAGLGGNSGVALLFERMFAHTAADRWIHAAYDQLRAAASDVSGRAGLFSGYAGLLFVVEKTSGELAQATRGMRQSLVKLVGECVESFLVKELVDLREMDLIDGLAGLRIAGEGDDAVRLRIDAIFEEIFGIESRLRWAAPVLGVEHLGAGWNNLGLAHGASGVIAASASSESGINIRAALDAVLEGRMDGGRWAAAIRGKERFNPRDAWCYGLPGTAAALAAYGVASSKPELINTAQTALHEMVHRRSHVHHEMDDALCHGRSGIALAYWCAGTLLADADLLAAAENIARDIACRFDERSPWGYRAILPDGRPMDDPSFLTGAAGIALTLGTICGTIDGSWSRAMGMQMGR